MEPITTSLDLITLSIAFAFKWNKTELIDKTNDWIDEFVKSLSESEKIEFIQKANQLK